MAGGEDDTALAAQMADSERHFGRGAHVVEEIYLDAVGREDVGTGLGKEAGVVSAVVTHHYRNLVQILEGGVEIVGQALRGSANGIDVHAVGAGAHDSAQTARTKLQTSVEGVDEGRLIGVVEHSLHFGARGVIEKRRGAPFAGHGLALFDQFLIFHNSII